MQGIVRQATMTFGGTNTSVADTTTNTSDRIPLPRADYTVQLTAIATGTSGTGATCVWQGSNDNLAWIALGSATATATQAGTSTTYVGAGITVTPKYAYGRAATVIVTGTGKASIAVAS